MRAQTINRLPISALKKWYILGELASVYIHSETKEPVFSKLIKHEYKIDFDTESAIMDQFGEKTSCSRFPLTFHFFFLFSFSFYLSLHLLSRGN